MVVTLPRVNTQTPTSTYITFIAQYDQSCDTLVVIEKRAV